MLHSQNLATLLRAKEMDAREASTHGGWSFVAWEAIHATLILI